MRAKFLFLIVMGIFLISSVSAMVSYGEWDDLSQSIQIDDGQSAIFIADFGTINPPMTFSIKLYDSQDNLVHSFEDNKVVNDNYFTKSYTITQGIYQTSGSFELILTGSDSSNADSHSIFLTIAPIPDTVDPVITLLGSNPQSILVGNPYVELGATATDNIDGDITSSIVIDASSVDTSTVGPYSVTYTVSDSSGNLNVVFRTVNVISVDTTNPTISITSPAPGSYNSAQTTLTYTASDDVFLDTCWYSTDGGVTNSSPIVCSGSFSVTSLEGTNTWTVYVRDTSGNEASDTVTFVVDTTAPVITITSPANDTSFNQGNTFDVSYTVTDATSSVDTCWYTIDGGATNPVVCGQNITIDTTGLALGAHEIIISSSDTLGNTINENLTFNVVAPGTDVTPPTITITSPIDQMTYTSHVTTLSFTASDPEGNLDSCWYSLDGGITTTTTPCGSNVVSITSVEGTNTWIVYANDTLGNQASASVTFTVNLSTESTSKKDDNKANYVFDDTVTEEDYLDQFITKVNKINLDEDEEKIKKSFLSQLWNTIINFFKRLFGAN